MHDSHNAQLPEDYTAHSITDSSMHRFSLGKHELLCFALRYPSIGLTVIFYISWNTFCVEWQHLHMKVAVNI